MSRKKVPICCAKCKMPLKKDERIHSRHTGASFCKDMEGCTRRAKGDLTLEEINMQIEWLKSALQVTEAPVEPV